MVASDFVRVQVVVSVIIEHQPVADQHLLLLLVLGLQGPDPGLVFH